MTSEAYEFVDSARVASVLRIRLKSHGDPFDVLAVDKLRFHLNGDPVLVSRVYEMLIDTASRVTVLNRGDKRPHDLGAGALTPVGFGDDEDLIPYPRYSHPAYRLMQEY